MEKITGQPERYHSMRRYAWFFVCSWTLMIGVLVVFNGVNIRREIFALARLEAVAGINKDAVYRRWAAGHGGVYVPVTEKMQPNPYLDHIAERDVTTTSGLDLTLVNPAYMTRQVHELGREEYKIRGHITSLKPTRPETAPDAWEIQALKSFEQGKIEAMERVVIDGQIYMCFMKPFITEKGCLACHARQGYKEGDIRGGISVSVSMAPYWDAAFSQITRSSIGLGIIWLVGFIVMFMGLNRFRLRIREKEQAYEERNRYLDELQKSIENGNRLRGLLPICAACKKVRDDNGYWQQVEAYIEKHSTAEFSHGLCPECEDKLYPDLTEEGKPGKKEH